MALFRVVSLHSPGRTGLPSATVTAAKGRGTRNLSQLFNLIAGYAETPRGTTGRLTRLGIRDTPLFTCRAGPRGPSGVIPPDSPFIIESISSRAASVPPLDEEPLTGLKPIFPQMEETIEPSLLLLINIRIPIFLWVYISGS